MDSRNLTDRQVRRLMADVGGMLRYLHDLQSRMQQLRFPEGDPLAEAADKARAAMQNLYCAAQGAGQPPKKPLRDE
jgi:hypothetical protein